MSTSPIENDVDAIRTHDAEYADPLPPRNVCAHYINRLAVQGRRDMLRHYDALAAEHAALLREVEALRGALAESREALNYYAELHPVSESAITQSMTAREAIAEIDAALSRRAVGEVDSAEEKQGGVK